MTRTHKFDLDQMYWANVTETEATRIGEIFHIRRNRIGNGSVSTPITRYFAWRPAYPEGVNPHWRIDCFVRKHKLARNHKKLAKLLTDKLIQLEICDQPIWVSWHESVELGGEPIGDMWDSE